MSIRAFNLGHVFKNVSALRDLDQSERWYRYALELYPENDTLSRRQCLAQLASVELQRVNDEMETSARREVVSGYLDTAISGFEWVLANTSPDDILGLAQIHNQLGVAYQYDADEQETAFEHFRLAIEYFDGAAESYEAASSRNNAVLSLERLNRLEEAIVLAAEALRIFEVLDPDSFLTNHVRGVLLRLESQA